MAIFLVEQDPFVESLNNDTHIATKGKDMLVRRPGIMGLKSRENTFGWIEVRSSVGGEAKPISLLNSSAPSGDPQSYGFSTTTTNFCLHSFDMQFQERAQVIQTFGANHTFFFGSQPTIASINGFLFNSRNFNWKNEWIANYQLYLRGTRCAETKSQVYLGFEDFVVRGFILSTNISVNADQPDMCPFSFTFLITDYLDLTWHNPRHFDDNDNDKGFSLNSAHNSGYDYFSYQSQLSGGVYPGKKARGNYYYVDRVENKVKSKSASDVTWSKFLSPSLDSPTTAHWLLDNSSTDSPPLFKGPVDAMREMGIRKYMEDNSVDRIRAMQAESEGKTLFSQSSEVNYDVLEALSNNAKNYMTVI
tara:strand:+ start:2506 stop:3588 length:1083 start_codon:yes stop_codon:yes gene_type:complete